MAVERHSSYHANEVRFGHISLKLVLRAMRDLHRTV